MIDKRHKNLRNRLDTYMEQARANEQKLRQFQDMELKLLSSESLPNLCRVLIDDYRMAFGLDVVTLLLIDRNNQLNDIFENTFKQNADQREDNKRLLDYILLINDYQILQELEQTTNSPLLAPYNGKKHEHFFREHCIGIGSVAILPMRRHGQLWGMLCLGSNDVNRYSPDMATDFLQRLALMATLSIENAVNIEYLRQLSLKDTLTCASNRRYFFQRLEEEINRAQRQSHTIGCLYMDLDYFKKINDQYGHAAGDMALIHVTDIVQKIIRASDVLARLGGEEFAVLLPDIGKRRMFEIAERIRMMVESKPFDLTPNKKITVTISIGLSYFDLTTVLGEPKQLGDALVNWADEALFYAKEKGRNRICSYDDIADTEHMN